MDMEPDATEPLAQQKALLVPQASGATTALSERVATAELALRPCGAKTGNAELAACLALVAPSGMGEAERQSWLAVARDTLRGIPEDLLKLGCQEARRFADHPSKIVPTIMQTVGAEWQRREDALIAARAWRPSPPQPMLEAQPIKKPVMERRGEPMDEADTAELNRILEWSGASVRYRRDGSKYPVGAE